MNSLKNVTYSLLVIISFSLISASAQAGGVSINIGGYGHGYQVGYNSYYPSAYFAYHRPIVTYRHHQRPYYSGYGYRKNHHSNHHSGHHQSYNTHDRHGSGHNSRRNHHSKNRHSSHSNHASRGYSRIASYRNHR